MNEALSVTDEGLLGGSKNMRENMKSQAGGSGVVDGILRVFRGLFGINSLLFAKKEFF